METSHPLDSCSKPDHLSVIRSHNKEVFQFLFCYLKLQAWDEAQFQPYLEKAMVSPSDSLRLQY